MKYLIFVLPCVDLKSNRNGQSTRKNRMMSIKREAIEIVIAFNILK